MEERDSCVFHANWLKAAQTIQDTNKRCMFYECVIHYALTGEQLEAPADIQLALTVIYGLADIDRNKYKQKCERYKENAKKRYQQQSQAMACNGMQSQTNEAIATDTDTETDSVTVTVTDTDKSKDLNNPPLPPQGDGDGFNFQEFYHKVQQTPIPKAIVDLKYENQYIWRMVSSDADYNVAISKAISATNDSMVLQQAIQSINKQHKANAPFKAVTLAMAMLKLKSKTQVEAFISEATRSASEPNIYSTLEKKADYIIQGNKVSSLKAFLQARK